MYNFNKKIRTVGQFWYRGFDPGSVKSVRRGRSVMISCIGGASGGSTPCEHKNIPFQRGTVYFWCG